MKTKPVVLMLSLAVLLAAGVGYFVFGSGKIGGTSAPVEIPPAALKPQSAAIPPAKGSAMVVATANSSGIITALVEKPLPEQIVAALSEANPTQRLVALAKVLSSMTEGNWRDGINIFSEQAKQHGRSHYQEWLLFVQRAGEIAGLDAMKYFAKNGGVEAARQCLTGWASKNPNAAIDWIETQADPKLRDQIFGAAVRGIVQNNVDQGVATLEQLPVEYRARYSRNLISDIVQAQGIDKAVEVFSGIAERAKADGSQNSDYVKETFTQLADKVFNKNRKNSVPELSAAWMSQHLGRAYVDPIQLDQVAADYASSNPVATVAWLDSIKAFPGTGEPVGYRTTIQTWVAKFGYQAAESWLQANRNSTHYDRMAIGLASTVRDLDKFNAIVGTIRDPNLRERAMKFAPAPTTQR